MAERPAALGTLLAAAPLVTAVLLLVTAVGPCRAPLHALACLPRLGNPWPELEKYAASIDLAGAEDVLHSHIPYGGWRRAWEEYQASRMARHVSSLFAVIARGAHAL